ncbi:MAG: flagellin, partial [Deltaproteobacteria bacterium]|nr:flagellin [Deltaproteobacteria bacterium]
MALTINTNIASLNAQRNLGRTQSLLNKSLQRLSSGLRINSAKDDAAGLAISSRMTSQIRGLNQAVRNANDGISLAQTAEGALQESGNILQRMRELAVQSANDSNSSSDRAAIQKEVAQLQAELNRIADQTTFNSKYLLDGTFAAQKFHVGSQADETIAISIGSARATDMGAYTSESKANIGVLTAFDTAANAVNSVVADDPLTVSGDLGTTDIAYAANATAAEIAAAIINVTGDTGVSATAKTAIDLELGVQAGIGDTVTFNLATVDGAGAAQGSVGSITHTITSTTDYSGLRDKINAVSASTGVVASLNTVTGLLSLTSEAGHDIELSDATSDAGDGVVF